MEIIQHKVSSINRNILGRFLKQYNSLVEQFLFICLLSSVIFLFFIWRSISMRAGPAFLQFDCRKPFLVWICQSSYIPVRRPASNFFQDREDIGKLFMWLQIFYFKQRRKNLTGLLFCLDLVCQGPLIIEIEFAFIISSFPVLKQLGVLLCLFI